MLCHVTARNRMKPRRCLTLQLKPLLSRQCQSVAMAATQAGDWTQQQNALDWYGVYNGMTACADCDGIATTITLARDNTLTRNQVYTGTERRGHFDKGSFTWTAQDLTLPLKAGTAEYRVYKVGENALFLLDKNGKRITGGNEDKYAGGKMKQMTALKERDGYWQN